MFDKAIVKREHFLVLPYWIRYSCQWAVLVGVVRGGPWKNLVKSPSIEAHSTLRCISSNTLPKTNSSPLTMDLPKRKLHLPTIHFQGFLQLLSGRVTRFGIFHFYLYLRKFDPILKVTRFCSCKLTKLSGGNSNICLFSSRKLGKIFTHFDGPHIFQMGWLVQPPTSKGLGLPILDGAQRSHGPK